MTKREETKASDATFMLRCMQSANYDRRKAMRLYRHHTGHSAAKAHTLFEYNIKNTLKTQNYALYLASMLELNDQAMRKAHIDGMETGRFDEFERLSRMQADALGIGARSDTNIFQILQQNNTQVNTIQEKSKEELLDIVRSTGSILAGLLPTNTGGSEQSSHTVETQARRG